MTDPDMKPIPLEDLRHRQDPQNGPGMTPDEHAAEAERLLDRAENIIPDDEPAQLAVCARAQVHALLAARPAPVPASWGDRIRAERAKEAASLRAPIAPAPPGPDDPPRIYRADLIAALEHIAITDGDSLYQRVVITRDFVEVTRYQANGELPTTTHRIEII